MSLKVEPGSWVNENTTRDQLDIENYLLKYVKDKTILHIGVGNSSLFDRLHHTNNVIGITIHDSERQLALEKGSIAFLCDKYSDEFIDLLKKLHFDIIVDNNPSSYANGKTAFFDYIKAIKDNLRKGNHFVTHLMGMDYATNDGVRVTLEDLSREFGSKYKTETHNNVVIITKL